MDSQRAKEHGVYRSVGLNMTPPLHGKEPLTPVEAKKMNPIKVGSAAPAAAPEEVFLTKRQLKNNIRNLKSQANMAAMKRVQEERERIYGSEPIISYTSTGLRR